MYGNVVWSFISTAFYVLGLLSCTCRGADMLNELGWESVRHKRTEHWPVQDDPAATTAAVQQTQPTSTMSGANSAVSLAGSVKSDGACQHLLLN